MVGKLLSLAFVALGAVASILNREVTTAQNGNTITINGATSGEVIVIQINQGGGAGWTNVATPLPATAGQTHMVTVGGPAGLVYSPESVTAAVGDIIEFHFLAKNHTVTQSTFAKPCVNAKLFDSGFVPNAMGMSPPPAMRVQVNSTDPTWFYCRQKGHCGEGMVFSLNPAASGKTAAAFKAAAIAQNGTAAAAAPPPAAAAPAATVSSVAAAAPPATSVAVGTGSNDSNGQCQCSCLCGVSSFADVSLQGKGNFGGFGGMLSPAAGMPVRR